MNTLNDFTLIGKARMEWELANREENSMNPYQEAITRIIELEDLNAALVHQIEIEAVVSDLGRDENDDLKRELSFRKRYMDDMEIVLNGDGNHSKEFTQVSRVAKLEAELKRLMGVQAIICSGF